MIRDSGFTRREAFMAAAAAGGAMIARRANAAEQPVPGGVPFAKPEDLGIDTKALQAAYDLAEKWSTGPNAPVPGASIMLGRGGKALPPRLFGRQGPEPDSPPIRRESLFSLASITKPIVCMAAMKLVERGKINLSDRVTRYLPEYKGKDKKDTLVLHFFTHTSGLPDAVSDNMELRRDHAPLSRFVERALETDVLFKPGTNHSYSSIGIILIAEIVRRLSGLTIQEFVKREILNPLGLKSMGLGTQGFANERLVHSMVPKSHDMSDFGWNSTYWREMGWPAGGMFSNAEDLAVICCTMLNGGQWNGVRILSPATIKMMTTNRNEDIPDLPESVRRTKPWGLGWSLNHKAAPEVLCDLKGHSIFGHIGASGKLVWMDPKTQTFCILITNYLRETAPWRLVHLSNAVAAAFV